MQRKGKTKRSWQKKVCGHVRNACREGVNKNYFLAPFYCKIVISHNGTTILICIQYRFLILIFVGNISPILAMLLVWSR